MQLRYLLIAVVACKSSGTDSPAKTHEQPAVQAPAAHLPLAAVTADDAVAKVSGPTPLLVLVDEAGKVTFAVGPAWSELAGFDPTGKTTVVDNLDDARKELSMANHHEWSPQQRLAALRGEDVTETAAQQKITEAEANEPTPTALDDDGKMSRHTPLSEQEKHALTSGELGSFGPPFDAKNGLFGDSRRAQAAGEVVDTLAPNQPALVLANPRAKASALVTAVMLTQGLIGVTHGGGVTALRIQFLRVLSNAIGPKWLEVHVGPKLEFQASQDAPATAVADNAALEAAYKAAKTDPYMVVDVLVAPDVETQHLVDVLVALEHAGARAIGLGLARK
jgi:hypothetical protein